MVYFSFLWKEEDPLGHEHIFAYNPPSWIFIHAGYIYVVWFHVESVHQRKMGKFEMENKKYIEQGYL